jgi:hypothetical protein
VEVCDDKGAAEMLARAASARSGKVGTAYQSVLDGLTEAGFIKLATGDGHLLRADRPLQGWDLERCLEAAEDVERATTGRTDIFDPSEFPQRFRPAVAVRKRCLNAIGRDVWIRPNSAFALPHGKFPARWTPLPQNRSLDLT